MEILRAAGQQSAADIEAGDEEDESGDDLTRCAEALLDCIRQDTCAGFRLSQEARNATADRTDIGCCEIHKCQHHPGDEPGLHRFTGNRPTIMHTEILDVHRDDEAEVERMTYENIDDYSANNHVPVKKGLKTILDYLKGHRYRIAVASSSPENVVKAHLKDADIDKYFDVIMCGNMVAKSKPEPDIYIEAAGKLKLPTSECYAFEDSESGLKAALASGCRTIMVPDLWQPDDVMRQKVAAVCKDLDEAAVYIDSDK